jgi:hypothetical protein
VTFLQDVSFFGEGGQDIGDILAIPSTRNVCCVDGKNHNIFMTRNGMHTIKDIWALKQGVAI